MAGCRVICHTGDAAKAGTLSAANQLPYLMTVAEFLDWETPDGSDRWELIDGTPEAMAPASDRHGAIHAEIAGLIRNHLAATRPDCRVIIESGVRPRESNVRVPDLSVTCGPIDPDARLGNPLVVIEILSPSNWRRTWENVSLFTTVPGIQEILVVHSMEIKAELLRRVSTGLWPRLMLAPNATVTLESIGFSAPLAAFYRTV
jgi:Uma2 family endonuclease